MPERGFSIEVGMYQPPRGAEHRALQGIQTSPDGVDWTEVNTLRCYTNLARQGLFHNISYDEVPTLELEFDRMLKKPRLAGEEVVALRSRRRAIREARAGMQESLVENGVGNPFIHTILPDHSLPDQRLLIRAGKLEFMRNSGGVAPRVLRTAETAYNNDTARLAAEEGYEAIICAPWQVWLDAGGFSDSQPTRLRLPGGASIVALPFSVRLQEAISWAQDRSNPDHFADRYIMPMYYEAAPNDYSHRFNLMVTDGETLGGHEGCEGVDEMMRELLQESLPNRGVTPISINKIDLSGDLPTGVLVERSSWSCRDGNLERWHGPCSCHDCQVSSREELVWKGPYYHAHHKLNGMVAEAVREEMGISDQELIDLMAGNFADMMKNPGGHKSTPLKSALSARASGFANTTSCATFFHKPETSGYINPLFAMQAIYHLRDAGLVGAAERIEGEYMSNMERVLFPYGQGTGRRMVEDLLERRVGIPHQEAA